MLLGLIAAGIGGYQPEGNREIAEWLAIAIVISELDGLKEGEATATRVDLELLGIDIQQAPGDGLIGFELGDQECTFLGAEDLIGG